MKLNITPNSTEYNSRIESVSSDATSRIANAGKKTSMLVLEPGRTERNYWTDLWAYRELFATLAWRDVVVQYKQTLIGVAWAVVRPLLTVLIFTVVFGRLADLPSEGSAPYSVMVMAGMLPWFLISTIVSQASNSLIQNQNFISKVYFPRLLVPTATSVVSLVDFAITLCLLFIVMAVYGTMPGLQLAVLPLFTIVAVLAALGPALIFASLNVKYRDFRIVVPFFIQFGLYVSPVGFSSNVVPEKWRMIYSLNPAVGIIDGFRWCLLGGDTPMPWRSVAPSIAVSVVFLWIGVKVFRSTEREFADLI